MGWELSSNIDRYQVCVFISVCNLDCSIKGLMLMISSYMWFSEVPYMSFDILERMCTHMYVCLRLCIYLCALKLLLSIEKVGPDELEWIHIADLTNLPLGIVKWLIQMHAHKHQYCVCKVPSFSATQSASGLTGS